MPWVYREVDVHKCKKPHWDKSVKQGDRWKCDECNLVWRVAKVSTWDDQRDPGPYGTITWELYNIVAPDPGVTSWRDQ